MVLWRTFVYDCLDYCSQMWLSHSVKLTPGIEVVQQNFDEDRLNVTGNLSGRMKARNIFYDIHVENPWRNEASLLEVKDPKIAIKILAQLLQQVAFHEPVSLQCFNRNSGRPTLGGCQCYQNGTGSSSVKNSGIQEMQMRAAASNSLSHQMPPFKGKCNYSVPTWLKLCKWILNICALIMF